jgi:hypothetical protein
VCVFWKQIQGSVERATSSNRKAFLVADTDVGTKRLKLLCRAETEAEAPYSSMSAHECFHTCLPTRVSG